MGAGAVGCYFGAMLARGGHDVTLIARPRHVAVIKDAGLLLETQSFQQYVRLGASSDPAAIRGAQCVLFCVKSTDTQDAASQIAPYVADDARALSLQNGVDNAQRAQILMACPVMPAAVYVAAEMAGPGHVRHHGRGELVIGPDAHSQTLKAEFDKAGVPVKISENVTGALWDKLIINCAYNALSAVTQLPYGRMVKGEGIETVMQLAVNEAVAVAKAAQIQVSEGIWQQARNIAQSMATQSSSTAQDLASGRPSEIDYLNGHIVREGARLGVETPVNETLLALVKTLEAKRDTRL